MIFNYLKVALRNLQKHKAYSAINIAGLVIGITCSFLIFLFVKAELSFDQFHIQSHKIHRTQHIYSFMNAQAGPTFKERYPEVEDFVRVNPWFNHSRVTLANQQEFFDRMYIVDHNFLDVFTFEIMAGDRETPLSGPDKVVLTESLAEKYFPNQSAIGQNLKAMGWGNREYNLTVSAVIKDVPFNSHMQFDFLVPFQLLEDDPRITIMESWVNDWIATYLVLDEQADVRGLELAYNDLWEEHTGLEPSDETIRIMPL